MRDLTKIATCCYCGTRTVLRLTGTVQHELSCSACGAKLHNMKPMKVEATGKRASRPKPSPPRPAPYHTKAPPAYTKRRKKKSAFHRFSDLFEDVWDEIEDIFD